MLKLGMVGWRGMVGSVLMDRMKQEDDFKFVSTTFFSTSNAGGKAPEVPNSDPILKDADDLDALAACDVVISCQGGDWTKAHFKPLRDKGWNGYWIDAASTLRMEKDAIIVLDPVNMDVIQKGLREGVKNYIGGNCTVSLMLMALDGLSALIWLNGFFHDLPSRFRRRCSQYARTARTDGCSLRRCC